MRLVGKHESSIPMFLSEPGNSVCYLRHCSLYAEQIRCQRESKSKQFSGMSGRIKSLPVIALLCLAVIATVALLVMRSGPDVSAVSMGRVAGENGTMQFKVAVTNHSPRKYGIVVGHRKVFHLRSGATTNWLSMTNFMLEPLSGREVIVATAKDGSFVSVQYQRQATGNELRWRALGARHKLCTTTPIWEDLADFKEP